MSLKLSAMHTCHALMNSDDDQNVVIKSFLRQLILRGIGKASPVWSLSVQSWKYFENTVWNITDAEQWKASKLIPPLADPTKKHQHSQRCLIFENHLKSTLYKWSWNGNGCMVVSPQSKIPTCLPRLGHWVPDTVESTRIEPFLAENRVILD